MEPNEILLLPAPVPVPVPRVVAVKQTLKQYMEQKKTRKIKRAARRGIVQRIDELRNDMVEAGIPFVNLSLRKLTVKGWSGYYGYLINVVRREVI